MILELKEHGISDHDIELMIKRNPARLVEHLL
jgi:predicted metal-dependent phosphotriesterase family hydrolase